MILKSHAPLHWREQLKQAITQVDQLAERLTLDPQALAAQIHPQAQAGHFALKVPLAFVERMQPGRLDDPLLLQVLPLSAELETPEGYVPDPLQEQAFNPLPGLIHKYRSRVLLTITGACALHCRYCFRRHFPYSDNQPGGQQREAIVDYLYAHPEINEVILSGGDPLSSPDAHLARWMATLDAVPHIKRLRLHTRFPVAIPERIDDDLLAWVKTTRSQLVFVLHINHPQELDARLIERLQGLRAAGVTLLNQSVLMKNINDSAQVLAELSERLFEAGVLPYYLHLLDRVQGAAHFALSADEIESLYQQLLSALPGFLVPKLVREQPEQPSKTPLGWPFSTR
ncbi:EF-P beta-lysylation protein EpmB [Marinospirillum sp.]|uniref:EF-P beta-lysylation protein EpmB n=1 Tax=Marinospirillum sp. TaxID=2183934 RepID=UPI003A88AAC6